MPGCWAERQAPVFSNIPENMDKKEVKCVIWDLDNTLWDGVLAEDDEVVLKPGIFDVIKSLDDRGILNSIASKNNFEDAIRKLQEFRLTEYFLYPQISWNAKSVSVKKILGKLNIAQDTILFVDDLAFEREEVQSLHPEVECLDASDYRDMLSLRRLNPRFVTEDSKRRRLMYFDDIRRDEEEQEFQGPKEEFLKGLGLKFIISRARENDLKRAEELTIRTNQLNATGITYSYEELDRLRTSEDHELLVCELTDKYGSYGKIGLALIEKSPGYWSVKMLLMSCRVISRGVGTVLLMHIIREAEKHGKKLRADFRMTDRNKMMYITYKFAGFEEVINDGKGNIMLEYGTHAMAAIPDHIDLSIL